MMKSVNRTIIIVLFLWITTYSGYAQNQDIVIPMDYQTGTQTLTSAAPIPMLPKTSDAHIHYAVEPVFDSNVYIYESGIHHKKCVVLIHGVGHEGSNIWGHLVQSLAKQYHVVAFDLPGFGRSEKKNALYSPDRYASFVKWIVNKYVQKNFVIIGHSLGGAVALVFAANYPKYLNRLVLIDVSGVIHRSVLTKFVLNGKPERNFSIRKLPKTLFNRIKTKAVGALEYKSLSNNIETVLQSASLREKILKADPVKIAGLSLANYDFSNILHKVNIPVFIYWGSNDFTTPIRTGKLLVTMLPKARLNMIPGSGHNPMIDHPKRFNHLMKHAITTQMKQPRSSPFKKSSRIGIFKHKHNIKISGNYQYVEISHCKGVQISNLTTAYIEIFRSIVTIENSRIKGKQFALKAMASTLTLTAVELEAETALIVSGSELDLAGVKIHGRQHAVKAINRTNILFSVSKVSCPYIDRYFHGLFEVSHRNPL